MIRTAQGGDTPVSFCLAYFSVRKQLRGRMFNNSCNVLHHQPPALANPPGPLINQSASVVISQTTSTIDILLSLVSLLLVASDWHWIDMLCVFAALQLMGFD